LACTRSKTTARCWVAHSLLCALSPYAIYAQPDILLLLTPPFVSRPLSLVLCPVIVSADQQITMPASTAAATFTLKNFNGALPSGTPDVGIISILKKQQGDTTFTFAFSDASLRDPKTLTGMTVGVEKPLGGTKVVSHGCVVYRRAHWLVSPDRPAPLLQMASRQQFPTTLPSALLLAT